MYTASGNLPSSKTIVVRMTANELSLLREYVDFSDKTRDRNYESDMVKTAWELLSMLARSNDWA